MKRVAPTRREFLKKVAIGSAALAIPQCRNSQKPPKKPNILFILTDDQRFDTIHALGNTDIITPHMDSLVRNGVAFRNAYIMGGLSAAVCIPSRAMLLTARAVFHLEKFGSNIPEEHLTLPELFKQTGYVTFGTGKWHNGKKSYARSFSTGAKIYFGGMSDHWKVPLHDFDPSGKYAREHRYFSSPDTHSSEIYADAAIEFLQNYDQKKPFFMYVSFQAPHDPRVMPQKYLEMYDPEKLPLPKNFMPEHPFDNGELKVRDELLAAWPRTPQEVRRHITEYYAIITHLDAQIGRILTALEKKGVAGNTIIVFAGDNGLALGQHGLLGKQSVYEHSVRVPCIISGPGIPKAEERDALCYLLDIYPTLCDLAGVSIPESVEGKSLVDVLHNKTDKARNALLFAYKNFQRAIRTGQWKLIYYNVKGQKTTQLFDLKNDPWEIKNLASEPTNSEIIDKLTVQMEQLFKMNGDKVELDQPDWGVPLIPSWGE